MNAVLEAARAAYARRDWPRARELFHDARAAGGLPADGWYALGDAAWWLGRNDEFFEACEQAYRGFVDAAQPRRAALAALDIAVGCFLRGDDTVGSGWLSRARRLLEGAEDAPERGYIAYILEVEGPLDGIVPSEPGALDALLAAARRVQDVGRRHGDTTLVAAGTLGEGRALVKAGRVAEGLALLDETMLAILSDDLNPAWAGSLYCQLMAAAEELGDIRRARDWTDATTRWLATLPAAVVFTGVCRVHRSRAHQRAGDWDLAEDEAARVCRELDGIFSGATAAAYHQLGEIRRLRGDHAGAEAAFARAHELGREPQPGYALLRLAQGRTAAAAASIRAALLAEPAPLRRATLLAAQVEILLAAGDADGADAACDELEAIAARYGSSGLEVAARHARGAALLAAGRFVDALPVLADACRRWTDVDAPYDCARVRVLLARAYRAVGDEDAAARELAVAVRVFERLGALPDARHARGLETPWTRPLPAALTPREVEVLRRVAAGRTNRGVAADLGISEKTVARHLSNIFAKLGVTTRTAATAFAFEHGLVPPMRSG
jgi:DNA-binding CsgD family transcriptional regulator